MASGGLEIKLSDEAFEALLATRLIHCKSLDCKHHSVNNDKWFGGHGSCTLKRIYIVENGKCEQFEQK
jgi:hypothetical protein